MNFVGVKLDLGKKQELQNRSNLTNHTTKNLDARIRTSEKEKF